NLLGEAIICEQVRTIANYERALDGHMTDVRKRTLTWVAGTNTPDFIAAAATLHTGAAVDIRWQQELREEQAYLDILEKWAKVNHIKANCANKNVKELIKNLENNTGGFADEGEWAAQMYAENLRAYLTKAAKAQNPPQ